MVKAAREDVKTLDEEIRNHDNTKYFMTAPWREWLLSCCELVICRLPDDQNLNEPEHMDGGASVFTSRQ